MRRFRTFNRFDDPDDPAMQPVYEAGGGESEGFEMAEDELIEHASHGDWGGTARITEHAEGFEEEEGEPDPDLYGEADDIIPHDDNRSDD
jgi:hypothetical protein